MYSGQSRIAGRFLATLILGFSSGTLCAQNASVPSISTQDQSAVQFDAGVTVSGEYTDNVFLTANDRRSDFVTVVAPWVGLSYRLEDFRLNVEASAEIGRFADNPSEDYEDFFLGTEAQYRISERLFAFGGLDLALDHEGRDSPDEVNGSRPTELRETSGYIGLGGAISDRSFRLGLNVRDIDYEDTPTSLGGVIDNDDRDRRQLELGGRIGVGRTPTGEYFFQGIYDRRDYDQQFDNQGTGFERSSKGYQVALGYTGAVGPMRGEVLFGLMSLDYDDARFDTTTAVDIGVDLSMPLGERTTLEAIVDRNIEETTLAGASGYISTSAGLRLRHRVSADMSLAAYGFLTRNDYQGFARNDVLLETGVSLRYYLNPRLYLDTNYDFRQRQSDVAGAEFDEHRITLSFGTVLEPRFDAETADLATSGGGGFYAGVQLGDTALQTKVDGPRGSGGNLTADFGDHSETGGVFAGYRNQYGSLVLGAELEAEFSNASWSHLANRDFSVERGNAFALSGMMGLRTVGGNLLYSRFGVVSAEFDNTYRRGSGAPVAISERETGLLFGVGAEIPLGNGFSGRIEYQLRAYEDYPLGSPLGSGSDDNFANIESIARFGLVYDFGTTNVAAGNRPKTDFSGFYAGASIGHGTLQSDNSGARVPGNPADPAFTLATTRGGQGFTGGGFAGYGIVTNGFYIGGEVLAEVSGADWNIERSPDGRIYSMKKTGTLGAALRVGYALNDTVLIYGRAGVVRSQFDVNYTYGSAVVDRNETLGGVRIGAGVEFAVGEKSTVRLEYTQTDYDASSVDYGSGVDQFDTSERMFSVGFSRRF